ncbi:hypothetical protein ig2599ANME_0889 [groundwater metagenome]
MHNRTQVETKKGEMILIKLRRTVYDPVAENFVSDKRLDYPEIKKWEEHELV